MTYESTISPIEEPHYAALFEALASNTTDLGDTGGSAMLVSYNIVSETKKPHFLNLVENALKSSEKGLFPEIQIHSSVVKEYETPLLLKGEIAGKSYYLIEVNDNGIGFDQLNTERIFNDFTRLHGMAESKGTGVCLSITRNVVENHTGYIWAESEIGKGARFNILLPAN